MCLDPSFAEDLETGVLPGPEHRHPFRGDLLLGQEPLEGLFAEEFDQRGEVEGLWQGVEGALGVEDAEGRHRVNANRIPLTLLFCAYL